MLLVMKFEWMLPARFGFEPDSTYSIVFSLMVSVALTVAQLNQTHFAHELSLHWLTFGQSFSLTLHVCMTWVDINLLLHIALVWLYTLFCMTWVWWPCISLHMTWVSPVPFMWMTRVYLTHVYTSLTHFLMFILSASNDQCLVC